VKRKELARQLEGTGCRLIRRIRNDWYENAETRIAQPVPRHNEINTNLAKHIMKMLKQDG
jgi:mRNA interferase HicA